MKSLIIGFGYKAGRGKSLCQQYTRELLNGYNLRSVKYCFANTLKVGIGMTIFGLNSRQLWGDDKSIVDEYWGMTPRDILQKAGTDAMRNVFGKDIWVKVAERELKKHLDLNVACLIDDVRFPNEAELIHKYGGIVIRIDRVMPGNEADSHESETAMDSYTKWDHVIANNGTKRDLKRSIRTIVTQLIIANGGLKT